MNQKRTGFNTKKALFVTNDFPPVVSGIATFFGEICRRLPADKIVVLAPKYPGAQDYDRKRKYPVVRIWLPFQNNFGAKIIKSFLNLVGIVKLIKKHKVGKLHCGQLLANGFAGWLVKLFWKIPYVVYVYGSETIRFGKWPFLTKLIKLIISQAEYLIVNSEYTKMEYLKFGISPNMIIKITPGVDTQKFTPGRKSNHLLQKYSLNHDPVLLTVARLDERKGHRLVIESLKELTRKWPNLKYFIVGEGELKTELQTLVKQLQLEDNVVFTGRVSDEELTDYYRLCDIFVLPNCIGQNHRWRQGDYEGFGMVFLEASACGKPVIGAISGGVDEAIQDGHTGYLIPANSKQALIKTISQLLENSQIAQQLGVNGHRRAVQEFDWHIIMKKLEPILV